jgi:CheY-like chemotaxis protein
MHADKVNKTMTMTLFPETFAHPVPQVIPAWRAMTQGEGFGSDPAMSGEPGERLLGKRILIVEDEALLALELQFAFEDEGADILGPAMSLENAMAIAAVGNEIDMAVLDVDIAGQDVYPVAALLQRRGIPFLFHTGHGSRAELEAMFPGAITCIKPTMPDTLVQELLRLGR